MRMNSPVCATVLLRESESFYTTRLGGGTERTGRLFNYASAGCGILGYTLGREIRGGAMRKTIFVSVVCLLASTIVVGEEKFQPLNIKPGQWQVTETFSATGLPAKTPGATQTINYKSCVT